MKKRNLCFTGAHVDCNTDGLSALHIAACKGHTEIIRLLLESGANPSAKDMYVLKMSLLRNQLGWPNE